MSEHPPIDEMGVCPGTDVACERDCVIMCKAHIEEPPYSWRARWSSHDLEAIVSASNPLLPAIPDGPPLEYAKDWWFPEPYEDVLLAYLLFRGPLPEPPPGGWPKPTRRQRFRMWRQDLNRRVQQWIHDHLTEAHCDC